MPGPRLEIVIDEWARPAPLPDDTWRIAPPLDDARRAAMQMRLDALLSTEIARPAPSPDSTPFSFTPDAVPLSDLALRRGWILDAMLAASISQPQKLSCLVTGI